MTFWTQPYELSKRAIPEEITGGRRLGFLEEITSAYDEATFISAQFGAEKALHDTEQENVYRIRQAGGQPPAMIGEEGGLGGLTPGQYRPYTESWRRASVNQNSDPQQAERNNQLMELQKKFPNAGILTYDQMFEAIHNRYIDVEHRAARDATTLGDVGWFIGGAAGGIDPRVNPLSAGSTLVGGVGKAALTRILSQGAGQAFAEAISQYTGVRENKRFLSGHYPSAGETAMQIGFAGAAGLVGQAVPEGVGFLGRKWFRNVPGDVPPPPPVRKPIQPAVTTPAAAAAAQAAPAPRVPRHEPVLSVQAEARITKAVRDTLGTGRANIRTAHADYGYVHDVIDRLDGPEPWRVPPNTSTRIFQTAETQGYAVKVQGAERTIDQRAREIDPETFRVYDEMQQRKLKQREGIAQSALAREQQISAELAPLDAEIATLRDKLSKATKRNVKKLTPRLNEAEALRAQKLAESRAKDTPGMAAQRQELQQSDYKMRDLAPAVSRAYARATGDWHASEALQADVKRMFDQGATTLTQSEAHALRDAELQINEFDKYFAPREAIEDVPELGQTLKTKPKDGADMVDHVEQVRKEGAKAEQEAVDQLIADAPKILAEADKPPPQVDAAIMFRGKLYTASDHSSAMEKIRQAFNFDKKVEQEMDALDEHSIGYASKGKFTAFSDTQAKSKGAFGRELSIGPKFKGKNLPALRIGNEIFVGKDHAEALGKAITQFGENSVEVHTFNDAANPLENIGMFNPPGQEKAGFVSNISGDNGKAIMAKTQESISSPPVAPEQGIVVPGFKRNLELDAVIHTPDGPRTVRDMLDELNELEEVEKAATTCSIGNTSKPA